MAGSLRERSPGVWEMRAFIGRDPITNKPRQVSKTFKGGIRQAEKELAKLVSNVDALREAKTSHTLGELLSEWLVQMERRGMSVLYIRNARNAIEKRLRPMLGHINLAKLTPEHLDRLYGTMRAEGLSDSTIRLHHNYIRTALGQAVKWEWILRSPAAKASPPKWDDRTMDPPEVADVRLLIATAVRSNPDLGSMILVAATTGLRRGELCGLRWSDINWEKRVLRVARSIAQTSPTLTVKETKTKKQRALAIDSRTAAYLEGHRVRCEGRWPIAAKGYIWSYSPGNTTPIPPATLTSFFMRIRKRCDLPDVRLHDLRHFSVTTLLTAGVDVRTVSGRHGHLNPTMTLQRYGHFQPVADAAASVIIGDHVFGDLPEPT